MISGLKNSFDLKILLWDLLYDIAGSILYAAGIYTFAGNADFAPGGVTGLALILNYLTGFPVGALTLLFNIPLVLISYKAVGKRLLLKSAKTMVIASFFLDAVFPVLPVYSGRAISYIAPYAFAVRGAGIEGISLGNATILDDFALSGLKNIRYVYLGNASYVGEGAFAGCYALEHISVSANNSAYMTDAQGALYEITSNKYKLVAYPSGNTATTYAINSKCGAVMPYAFYGADSLEYVSYGGTLAEIGEYAFSDCAALKAIYYTNTPSSSVIAGVADFNVTNSSVGYIGAHAFAGCDLLNTYRFDNIAFLGEYAVDWDGASDITIYLNVSALCASDGIAVELPDGAGGVTGRLTIHAGDLCEEYSAAKYWSELRAYIVE